MSHRRVCSTPLCGLVEPGSRAETALAAAGVSRDIRGQLQSHGLAGVQAKHYDDHDYLPEKRRALETLLKVLETQSRAAQASRNRS